jgi:hypothetical protein
LRHLSPQPHLSRRVVHHVEHELKRRLIAFGRGNLNFVPRLGLRFRSRALGPASAGAGSTMGHLDFQYSSERK